MANISGEITNASGITVFDPKVGRTLSTELGSVSVGATVIAASKGRVGEIMWLNAKNFLDYLGSPLGVSSGQIGDASAYGAFRDGLYHLADALDYTKGGVEGCEYVGVMRVVPSDAEFPTITFAVAGTITAGSETYGTAVTAGAGTLFVLYPIDGDPSTNRSFEITNVFDDTIAAWADATSYLVGDTVDGGGDWASKGWFLVCTEAHTSSTAIDMTKFEWRKLPVKPERFEITLYDKDVNGDEYVLETHTVSMNPEGVDDLGRSAYMPDVLERDSIIFRCAFNDGASDWATMKPLFEAAAKTAFAGGTNGTLTTITSQEWKDAWDAFRGGAIPCDLMFMSGNRDPDVIAYAAGIAKERRARLFGDLNPNARWADALQEQMSMSVDSRFLTMCYCPVIANDPFTDGTAVWGASGAAVCSKVKGHAQTVGKIPGIHRAIAQAGIDMLSRTGIKFAFPDDSAIPAMQADARINPVVPGTSGGAVFNDALTNHFSEDYLRFQWVCDIVSYIDKRYYNLAQSLKFNPSNDYKQKVLDGMTAIMDECVAAGFLVQPRNPEKDGVKEYVLDFKEESIDTFIVYASYCPSGCARRQAFQPYLFE